MKIRWVFFYLCVLIPVLSLKAQLISSKLKITGLTCSACSYGTERSIRQLKFVENVKMDLNTHSAEVTFKKGETISIEKLVQKVYDAGFSVSEVRALWHFTNEKPSDKTWVSEGSTYYILNDLLPELTGDKEMTFVGEKYMNKKDYHLYQDKMKAITSMPGFSGLKGLYFVVF